MQSSDVSRGAAALLLDRVRGSAWASATSEGPEVPHQAHAAGGGGCMAGGREAGAGG